MSFPAKIVIPTVALFWAGALAQAEEKVPLERVPQAVVAALKQRFPQAELVAAHQEQLGDQTLYLVTVKHKDRTVLVTLTSEGTPQRIATEIDAKHLPSKVSAALEAMFPKAMIEKASELVKVAEGKETPSIYEVHLVTFEKKKLEVTVSREGKIAVILEKGQDKGKKL